MRNRPPGRIITFYSYKGGTGRSMALANVAWILASNGKRVLMLDWDLEAPGLHRYFHPFLVDKELSASDGLIDFVLKFAAAAATPEPTAAGQAKRAPFVYLAPTDPALDASREAVGNVLVESGYEVSPADKLPTDPHDFESAVRSHLAKAALSVHLIGREPADEETYPYVYRQNALAAERDNEPGFSRLIWLSPDAQSMPRQLLLGEPSEAEASGAVTLSHVPLDELFNIIRERLKKEQTDKDWYKPYANILRYASSLEGSFKGEDGKQDGSLDFIPAGRQGPSYSTRVNSFNWQNFYDRLGGGVLFEIAKERMRAEYDYILIDSRTGVSDTSGICTVQMPDLLVVCFTLNNQSIEGAGAVADSVHAQRPELPIFPIPTRVEKFEKDRLELAREAARAKFGHLLGHIEEDKGRVDYWSNVEFFYEPFYAYEEVLATFKEKPRQINSLLASAERLTGYLTNSAVTQLVPAPESERQIVLAKYARQAKRREPARPTTPARDFWFYLSYSRNDDVELIEKFFGDLSDEVRIRLGLSPSEGVGFFDSKAISLGDDWDASLTQALENSRVLVALYSPAYFKSVSCGKEFQYFWERMKAEGLLIGNRPSSLILPVVWVPTRGALPEAASQIQYAHTEGGLRRLMRSGSQQSEYRDFIDLVADRLVDVAQEAPRPSPPGVLSLRDLPSAFEETATDSLTTPASSPARPAGPNIANFVYVAARAEEMSSVRSNLGAYDDTGRGWRPFLPAVELPVGIMAAMAATQEALMPDMILVDDDLPTRVRQAEQSNSPVILVVDPWATLLPRYREILRNFDKYAFINCAVLIVWNVRDDETSAATDMLRQSVLEAFEYHWMAAQKDFLTEVHSEEEFLKALSHSLSALRLSILDRGIVMRPLETGVAKPVLSKTPMISDER